MLHKPLAIKSGKTTIAIFIPQNTKVDGVEFITPQNYPLQIGLMQHKNGKFVPAHYHPHLKYNVLNTQELLYIIKGRVDVEIFTKTWKPKWKKTLVPGDAILFVDCGHSVNLRKGSRVIEVKQGPYPGDKKAKVFRERNFKKYF